MRLQVSDNGRFLVRQDGSPFFYLGDTAWELFHRLTLSEAEHYLRRRAEQGFTVVQAVVLAEIDGLSTPNANGDRPLIDEDPTQPNEPYFAHVDAIVRLANQAGIVVAMLPTWADKVNRMWGGGPEIFTPENAWTYGEFLGRRYREADLIWVLGGDRAASEERVKEVWRALAAGIRSQDPNHLTTFHPMGGHASSTDLHEEPWLDFNMIQSGHHERNSANYRMIARDYGREPAKPCMDAESAYEDHPVNWKPDELGWFSDLEVRRPSYWGVFAGGHGLTYGCHDVWQMWAPGRAPIAWARRPWREALELPAASQMQHLKRLVLSRPFLDRIPDQSLIVGDPGDGADHAQATRAADGAYAFVYFASRRSLRVDTAKLSGEALRAWWFDPRTGEASEAETASSPVFTPPGEGDWVLVLDDASRSFEAPGS
jgi:hypothetical protein